MMKSAYTISIIGPAGSAIRQYAVAKRTVCLGIVLAAMAAVAIIAGTVDYMHLQKQAATVAALNARLLEKNQLITMQRQQVQAFAEDINGLKDRLVAISDFEKRIRVIANLDNEPESAGVFGMGGAPLEDLDPALPLKEAHGALIRDMHDQTRQLGAATTRQAQRFTSLLTHLEQQIDRLAATPSIRPAKGWITSRFEKRTSPFTGRLEFHNALDIASDMGTPIMATADGVIAYSGRKWLLGKTIAIDHGHGMVTRYGHCQELLKKPGDPVKRGDIIARMGNTGRSTGPHVHYEVRLNGIAVNPEDYILN
jgi:murein DD-endopeptidase MepM/ murein hydrolase activator NlpD